MSSLKKRKSGRREYKLGQEYCNQQQYGKAEQQLQKLVQQQERVLGAEHVDTLWSKYQLAITLDNQQKYAEAEQLLRQLMPRREMVLGAEHVNTLESKYWLVVALHNQ
jgi:tetratricopeptide (TPR) repeat protein